MYTRKTKKKYKFKPSSRAVGNPLLKTILNRLNIDQGATLRSIWWLRPLYQQSELLLSTIHWYMALDPIYRWGRICEVAYLHHAPHALEPHICILEAASLDHLVERRATLLTFLSLLFFLLKILRNRRRRRRKFDCDWAIERRRLRQPQERVYLRGNSLI